MASRWTVVAAIVLVGTTMVGCGGSDDPDQTAGSAQSAASEAAAAIESAASEAATAIESAASVIPSDLGEATAGDTDLDGEADEGAALTSAQLCGFLDEAAPEVRDLQPAEYAAAIFGSKLFGFYTEQGLLTDIDGADMDDLAAEGCPDEAADLLPALGADSFAALLSQ